MKYRSVHIIVIDLLVINFVFLLL